MREAKVNDSWRNLYRSNKYRYKIKSVELDGIINGCFKAYNGISAICGLNGAGKSTVMVSIKDALGINLKQHDRNKIEMQRIKLEIEKDESCIFIENEDGKRLIDVIRDSYSAYYLDFGLAIKANEYLMQDNLHELVDQYEDEVLSDKELDEISYLVGKKYSKCSITEIDDDKDIESPYFQSKVIDGIENDDEEIRIPYFKVVSQGIEYDSLTMGLGESILFYFYWFFRRISKSCIVLFEEPEAFLNIKSQENLMNFISEKCYKLGINMIVSTHSPHLINRLQNDNIYVLSKYYDYTDISNSENKKEALMTLGMSSSKAGIFYVEDEAAKYFLNILLFENRNDIKKMFDIEVVNGEGNVTNRLKFPKSEEFSYNLIGVYDGDMRNQINNSHINWGYTFLPGESPIEIELRDVLNKNLKDFADKNKIKMRTIIQILHKHDGENYHDWFTNIASELGYSVEHFVKVLYKFWIVEEKNQQSVKIFFKELDGLLKSSEKSMCFG